MMSIPGQYPTHLPSEPPRERLTEPLSEHRVADPGDQPPGRPREPEDLRPVRGRRGGYVGSIVVNLILLWLINGWPGWDAVPFLTGRTVLVVGAVNASIIARVVADAVNVVLDLPRPRALGDLVSIGFGLVALIEIWQVFPLDVIGTAWEVVARVLLVLGFVGGGVGILDSLSRLVRGRFPRM
ncbi:hypothetical protein [Terrabacter carboxydivorans]|uniref:Uncharacterized protein n=1 Tax=Terrabacter carboxydivorans TaxID=619730 RepID=A0ABN3KTP2_9MICO